MALNARGVHLERHVVNLCCLVDWPESICPLSNVTPSFQTWLRMYSGHHLTLTTFYQAVCKLI